MSKNKNFTNHNKEAYDVWASFYDTYPNPTVCADELEFPGFWRHVRGKRVLEIGCGTGRHTAKLVAQGNSVTALDLSSQMLAVAKSKLDLQDVKFIEADFLNYQFDVTAPFNVILASLVLEHFEDLEPVFEKVGSILAVDGDVFFSEIHPLRAHAGKLAHFNKPDGSGEVHLLGAAHTNAQFESAIRNSKLRVIQREDIVGSEDLAALNPKWVDRIGMPLVQVWHLTKT